MSQQRSPLAEPEPWDLVAEGYAAEAPLVMEPLADHAIDLARAPVGARIVDVACGSGTLALHIAPSVAHVSAIDFSEGMLAELRRRAAQRGIENVEARRGDGQDLPYLADSFDAGFSLFGLMFFPDRARGFAELRRVLRPGGVAVISSWAPASESSLMVLMFGAIGAIDPTWKAPERNLLSLEDVGRFEIELRDAGFADVAVTPHVHSFEARSASWLWSALVRSNAPLVLMRKRMGEDAWADGSVAAVTYLEREMRGGRRLSTKALFGRGTKQ